jgi:hypothetical protein
MIFPVARQIAYISTFTTLVPGDIIVTGTPTGAGARFDPPVFLKPGDVVEVEAEGIGMLEKRRGRTRHEHWAKPKSKQAGEDRLFEADKNRRIQMRPADASPIRANGDGRRLCGAGRACPPQAAGRPAR